MRVLFAFIITFMRMTYVGTSVDIVRDNYLAKRSSRIEKVIEVYYIHSPSQS